MSRLSRVDVGNQFYHVLNRANARMPIFKKEKDFIAFENILEEAKDRYSMRILAYCLMPNHWHFILYPRDNGDLSSFMQWVTLTHTQRWHAHYHSTGNGHLYQGRYKSFLIQDSHYLLTACAYVESNAFRAKLVKKSENWQWSSLWRRERGNANQKELLSSWPLEIPEDYLKSINKPLNEKQLERIRECVNKNRPFGGGVWLDKVIRKFRLEMTFRKQGRPKNGT